MQSYSDQASLIIKRNKQEPEDFYCDAKFFNNDLHWDHVLIFQPRGESGEINTKKGISLINWLLMDALRNTASFKSIHHQYDSSLAKESTSKTQQIAQEIVALDQDKGLWYKLRYLNPFSSLDKDASLSEKALMHVTGFVNALLMCFELPLKTIGALFATPYAICNEVPDEESTWKNTILKWLTFPLNLVAQPFLILGDMFRDIRCFFDGCLNLAFNRQNVTWNDSLDIIKSSFVHFFSATFIGLISIGSRLFGRTAVLTLDSNHESVPFKARGRNSTAAISSRFSGSKPAFHSNPYMSDDSYFSENSPENDSSSSVSENNQEISEPSYNRCHI